METAAPSPKELKRRLLLTKWHDAQGRDHEEAIADLTWRVERAEAALQTVRYWLHDFFFLHRMSKSAREILRIVEDTL